MRVTAAELEDMRELAMVDWDPIGVHLEENDAEDRACYWDEYDAYLPTIAEHPRRREGVDQLADYLAGVGMIDMGLPARREPDVKAAVAIVEWYDRARPS